MEHRRVCKVLHTELNQPKPPGMNDTRKASSQGKTDPDALTNFWKDANLHHRQLHRAPGSGEPWFKHQLGLLLAMDSQASWFTPLDPSSCFKTWITMVYLLWRARGKITRRVELTVPDVCTWETLYIRQGSVVTIPVRCFTTYHTVSY